MKFRNVCVAIVSVLFVALVALLYFDRDQQPLALPKTDQPREEMLSPAANHLKEEQEVFTNGSSDLRHVPLTPLGASAAGRDSVTHVNEPEDRGRSSPSAAITSMQWALSSYNPAALAELIYIADTDRGEVQSMMSRLSEEQQSEYKSPELLLSTLLCDPSNMKEIASMKVLSEDRVDHENSVVRVQATDRSGRALEGAYYLHKTADGWKWVMSSASVKEALATIQLEDPKR